MLCLPSFLGGLETYDSEGNSAWVLSLPPFLGGLKIYQGFKHETSVVFDLFFRGIENVTY